MSFNSNYQFNKTSVWGTILIICLMSSLASADEQLALGTEQDMFADFSVTSATRLAQSPRDLPVSVTIIDRKMIEASGATEIADLFRIVPGFRVTMIDGGLYAVFGHGSSLGGGRNLEVLIDGLPVQSPLVNVVDWLSLPIEINDIDYIEVMRGTSVAVYGSNAFDGAINIVTKKPFEEQGMSYRVTYGDDDLKNYQLKYGFETDGATHTISAVYKKNDGFDNVPDENDNSKITYNGNYNPSVHDEVNVMLSFHQSYKDNEDPLGNKRPRELDSNSQYINWRHKYNSEEEFILKAYHHYFKFDNTYSLGLISDLFGISPALVPILFGGHSDQEIISGTVSATSNRYGIDAQQNYNYDDLRIAVGAGLIYDKLVSDYVFNDDRNISGLYRQLFSNMEWRVREDFVINAGLLAEKIEDRDTEVSSRLSLNYHINDENTIRLGAARSFRGRSVYSANVSIVARYAQDGDIFGVASDSRGYDTPELVTTYELAYLFNFPNKNLYLDFRLFKDIYDDVRTVVLDSSYPDDAGNGAFVSVNGGSYEVDGFEFQLKYEPVNNGFLALQYTRADSKGMIVNNLAGTSFDDFSDAMPKHSYGLMLGVNLYRSFDIGLTYTKLSDLNWRSNFTPAGKVPGYDRLDVNLNYDFKIKSSEARLELIAQNLLDDYSEYVSNNVFDTRLLLRFSLRH